MTSETPESLSPFDKGETLLKPETIKIPDLSPLKEGEDLGRNFEIPVEVAWNEKRVYVTVELSRNKNLEEQRQKDSRTKHATPVQCAINGFNKEQRNFYEDKMFRFDGMLFEFSDSDQEDAWRITYRMVEPEFRGDNNFGELGIRLYIEVIEKIIAQYPELRTKNIEIHTSHPMLVHLIIDQDWLEKNDLERFKRKKGINLGFRPAENSDLSQVKNLVELFNTEDRSKALREKEIVFVRPLK